MYHNEFFYAAKIQLFLIFSAFLPKIKEYIPDFYQKSRNTILVFTKNGSEQRHLPYPLGAVVLVGTGVGFEAVLSCGGGGFAVGQYLFHH
jgi:hypothetical protein